VAAGAFLVAGGVLAILGLLGTTWIGKFSALNAVTAHIPKVIRGVPGAESGFQPNAVAGCLVLFVPVQIALLAEGARWWHAPGDGRVAGWPLFIQGALLALTAGTLVLTQSRGAGVGLLVALAAAALAWVGPRTRALILMAIAAGVVVTITLDPARLLEFTVSRLGAGVANDLSSRAEVWSRAVYGIHDFPLTGMGMNTFRKVMPILYPTLQTPRQFDVVHAHNHLLQAALDLGLPGLVAYLAIWLGTAGLLVRVYRRSDVRSHRAMAGGLGAGLIAYFMFGMTDAIALGAKVGVLFWMTLALCVSLHQVALPEEPVRSPPT
jgi:putative inorganic carbon (HCO3(-)) transporter